MYSLLFLSVFLIVLALEVNGELLRSPIKGEPDNETEKGCTCTSQCHAAVDFGKSKNDFCFTNKCGAFSATRFKFWDYCVYNPDMEYENQTASDKMKYLWSKVTEDSESGSYPPPAGLLGVFTESVVTSFENNRDTMPKGRKKFIHSVGSVGQAIFISDENSPYTGVFKGANDILIRFSTAKAFEGTTSITPGFGIKFLLDGAPSTNFMAMPALDAQEGFNFFKNTFTNHPANPKDISVQLLSKKFTQASGCPLMVGISEAASFNPDGTKVKEPNFPYEILFKPTSDVGFFPEEESDAKTFAALFGEIPVGAQLFEVYGRVAPFDDNLVRIGGLFSASSFVTSKFGDESLFFRHVYVENDFKLFPARLASMKHEYGGDLTQLCGTVNGPNVSTQENIVLTE